VPRVRIRGVRAVEKAKTDPQPRKRGQPQPRVKTKDPIFTHGRLAKESVF